MNKPAPTTKMYFAIWGALLVLLVLTWWVATLKLGEWNIVAAMSIAVIKMLLVVLFFMHVRYSSKITWVFVAAGFFWFLIMVALTMGDYMTRSELTF